MAESIWFGVGGFAVAMTIAAAALFLLPALLIRTISSAPELASRLGIEGSPWLLRLGAAFLILPLGYVLAPGLTRLAVGIAVILLPAAIAICLLLGLAHALSASRDSFGVRFWHFSRHAVPLCAAFSLLVVPFGYTKWRSVEDSRSGASAASRR